MLVYNGLAISSDKKNYNISGVFESEEEIKKEEERLLNDGYTIVETNIYKGEMNRFYTEERKGSR